MQILCDSLIKLLIRYGVDALLFLIVTEFTAPIPGLLEEILHSSVRAEGWPGCVRR